MGQHNVFTNGEVKINLAAVRRNRAARLSLTLTLAVPHQPHVVGAVAEETHRLVLTLMRAASIIDPTLVLICE